MKPRSTENIERKILLMSFLIGLFFVAVEFITAIYTHSNSMLMDATFDATELIVIVLTIFLTPLFHKPLSERRPFGYAQVESVFITIRNVMMISVTVGLLSDTIKIMLNGGNAVNSVFVARFQLALGIISLVVLGVMKKINRKITSPIIATEIYAWKMDTYYSLGMSGAFYMASILKDSVFSPIIPYFDQIVAIAIVLFMIPQAIKMLFSSLRDMFLFSPDSATIETVRGTALEALEPYGFKIGSCDIYRTGRILWADIYITTEQDFLNIVEFENARSSLQDRLKEKLEGCQSELILQNSIDPV